MVNRGWRKLYKKDRKRPPLDKFLSQKHGLCGGKCGKKGLFFTNFPCFTLKTA